MGGGSGGYNKSGTAANNTGTPAWSSGMGAFAPPPGSATASGPGSGPANATMNAFTPPPGSATASGPGSATVAGPGGYANPAGAPPPSGLTALQQSGLTSGVNTALQGGVGGGATTAPQGGAPGPTPQATGPAPAPGTDAYNAMNTQLTTGPMQAINNLIQGGGLDPQTQQVLQNLLGTSGSNAAMDAAGRMYQNLGGSGTQNFQGVYNAAGQPGANEKYLTDFASGGMMNSNPYLDAITEKAERDAATNTNQMFAAGGRYGSGANQGTVAEAVANANNTFRGQEYENEAGRRLTAANQIGNEQLGRLGAQNTAAQGVGGLQTAAAQGLGGLGSDAMKNWLTAQTGAGTIGSQGTQNMIAGIGQLPTVQGNKMFDTNQQLNVGNMTTAQTQQQINDLVNQWTQGDMSDWARTGALASAGTGTAGNWGTSTGTQKQTSQAGIGSIIGGLLSMMG